MGIVAYLPNREPEFITSWKGFSAFNDAMNQLGTAHFPMIIEQLPDGDEGFTSPQKAATMLDELTYFIQMQEQVSQAVLVDTERGGDISMGSNVMGGALTMDRVSGYDLGFDEDGFFVRDRWEMNRILFQAMRVQQNLILPEEHTVEYVNLDTGQTFQCNTPFGKPITADDGIPRMLLYQFHVEVRPTAPNRFAYITDPLRVVLEYAVEHDHEIQWT